MSRQVIEGMSGNKPYRSETKGLVEGVKMIEAAIGTEEKGQFGKAMFKAGFHWGKLQEQ